MADTEAWFSELRRILDMAEQDRVEQQALAAALARPLQALRLEAARLRGATPAQQQDLKQLADGIDTLLAAGRAQRAQERMAALSELIQQTSQAIEQQQRQAEALAALQRRWQQALDRSQALIREDLEKIPPSPEMNERHGRLRDLRLAGPQALQQASAALGTDADRCDAALKRAATVVRGMVDENLALEKILKAQDAKGAQDSIRKLHDEVSALPGMDRLPQLRAALGQQSALARKWKDSHQPAQQLAVLAQARDTITLCRDFLAAAQPLRAEHQALVAAPLTLPAHAQALTEALDAAWQQADQRLAQQLDAQDTLQPAAALQARVKDFNDQLKSLDALRTPLRADWTRLQAQLDNAQAATLGARIPALLDATPDFGTVAALHAQATQDRQDLTLAEQSSQAFLSALTNWRTFAKSCTGALAAHGKAVTTSLATHEAQAKATGYAAALAALHPDQLADCLPRPAQLIASLGAARQSAQVNDPLLAGHCASQTALIIATLDFSQPALYAQAADSAAALASAMSAAKSVGSSAQQLRTLLQGLGLTASLLNPLLVRVDQAGALKLSDPVAAQAQLDELTALKDAAASYVKLVQGIGGPFKKATEKLPSGLKKAVDQHRSTIRKDVEDASPLTIQALSTGGSRLTDLKALLPHLEAYAVKDTIARNKLAAARGVGAAATLTADAAVDDAHAKELDDLAQSLQDQLAEATCQKANTRLDALIATLDQLGQARRQAAKTQLLTTHPELTGALSTLCALPQGVGGASGDDVFAQLVAGMGGEDTAKLLAQLQVQKAAKPLPNGQPPTPAPDGSPDPATTEATARALLQLGRKFPPAQLKALMNEGCGGATGLAQLLEQGLNGDVEALHQIGKDYPDAPKLKAMMEESFGGLNQTTQVLKTAQGSGALLKQVDDAFAGDRKALRTLSDTALGGPAGLGHVLGKGCGRDAQKLKALDSAFTTTELADLASTGCGNTEALASVMGLACGGKAGELRKLHDAFTVAPDDLDKLHELVTCLANAKADVGTRMKALLDNQFGGDITKLRKLYDKVATALPTVTERQRLLKHSARFKSKTPAPDTIKATLPAGLDSGRYEHFLDRHHPDHFNFGNTAKGTPNIKASNTQWGPDTEMADIKAVLQQAINQTGKNLDASMFAADTFMAHELDLPEFGVKVKIGYKLKNNGKIIVDQFFPVDTIPQVHVDAKKPKKQLTLDHFSQQDMQALKEAFGH